MSKFYAHLMNLELESENQDEAGMAGCLDLVTGHIIDYLGKEFKLVVTTNPLDIRKSISVEFPEKEEEDA